jgi:hypothetical protein
MGNANSCESELTAANTKLASLKTQLTALSTTSTCAVSLSNEKIKLSDINDAITSAAAGTDVCTTALPATTAKTATLTTALNNTQNSACNQSLTAAKANLAATQSTQATNQSTYNSLTAAEQAAEQAAVAKITSLQAQLKADQAKYNALETAISNASSTCINQGLVDNAQITTLNEQIAAQNQKNLAAASSASAASIACTASMAGTKSTNESTLTGLNATLTAATTDVDNYTTSLIQNLATNASYAGTNFTNANTIANLTAQLATLNALQTTSTNELNSFGVNGTNSISSLQASLNNQNNAMIDATKTLNASQVQVTEAAASYNTKVLAFNQTVSSLQALSATINTNNSKYSTWPSSATANVDQWGWIGGPYAIYGSSTLFTAYTMAPDADILDNSAQFPYFPISSLVPSTTLSGSTGFNNVYNGGTKAVMIPAITINPSIAKYYINSVWTGNMTCPEIANYSMNCPSINFAITLGVAKNYSNSMYPGSTASLPFG